MARATLELLAQLGDVRANALGPVVDAVIETLVDPPDYDPELRRRWARLHPTQQEDASTVDERNRQVHHVAIAATVVGTLAVEHPDAVAEHLQALVDVVEWVDAEAVRYHLIEAIQAVAETDPDAAAPAMTATAQQFEETDNRNVREKVAWTLT